MLAQRAIAASPRSFAAHHQAGVALDLLGRYAEARTHFTSALDVASTLDTRAAARRSTAVSYAFENNCADAVKEETTVYKDYFAAKNFLATSEVAYQAGTICLEAGDFKLASDWFAAGRSVIRQHRDPTPVETELFRYRDAQTRARASRPGGAPTRPHSHT